MGFDKDGWGVLYMVWGTSHDPLLSRATESLQQYHPDLPVHVHRVPETEAGSGSAEMFLTKAAMASLSPFEKTLYLDADTIVMGPLDYGFEKATQFGLACCICECPWAQRYGGLRQMEGLIEYNTGVLFFTGDANPVMSMWERLARVVDSSTRYVDNGVEKTMEHNDQGAFARAVEITRFNPYVLPLNWNFRPRWHRSFFGPIRIWHDVAPPPDDIARLNAYYRNPEAIYMDVRLS